MFRRASNRAIQRVSGLAIAIGLGSIAGCGSDGDAGAASATDSGPAAAGSAATANAPAAMVAAPPSPDSTPATASSAGMSAEVGSATPDNAAQDACSELGGSDACGACVCMSCRGALDACLAVEGCPDILACVRHSACSGRDCYCGDASLAECVLGAARGPCVEVVLTAPGGKAPTLTDPSAGPASDAALRVAECAEADAGCRELCGVGD